MRILQANEWVGNCPWVSSLWAISSTYVTFTLSPFPVCTKEYAGHREGKRKRIVGEGSRDEPVSGPLVPFLSILGPSSSSVKEYYKSNREKLCLHGIQYYPQIKISLIRAFFWSEIWNSEKNIPLPKYKSWAGLLMSQRDELSHDHTPQMMPSPVPTSLWPCEIPVVRGTL